MRERVNVWRGYLAAVVAYIAPTQVIRDDQNDIWAFLCVRQTIVQCNAKGEKCKTNICHWIGIRRSIKTFIEHFIIYDKVFNKCL